MSQTVNIHSVVWWFNAKLDTGIHPDIFFFLLPLQIPVKLVTEGMDAAPVRVPVEGVRGSV